MLIETVKLWPDRADVELTIFVTPAKPPISCGKRPAVIICPGGAYAVLAYEKEGQEVAQWLAGLGYNAYVLAYRVPNNRLGALQDVQRAIRIVRSKGATQVGVIGFSAGASLSCRAATRWDSPAYEPNPKDKIDSLSCRPDFGILIYPAYLDEGERRGYEHIVLAGHSLGANKVIYYLSRHHDPRVEHFFLLSPANLTYMMSGVTAREKQLIRDQVERGDGDKMLPFPFMGWVECIANTAYDWQFSGMLNNVHTAHDGDFSQAEKITHNGALLVGTYDNFTDGDPSDFLRNLNAHMPTADQNKLIFIEKTGHTYQMKNQEVADDILAQLNEWRAA